MRFNLTSCIHGKKIQLEQKVSFWSPGDIKMMNLKIICFFIYVVNNILPLTVVEFNEMWFILCFWKKVLTSSRCTPLQLLYERLDEANRVVLDVLAEATKMYCEADNRIRQTNTETFFGEHIMNDQSWQNSNLNIARWIVFYARIDVKVIKSIDYP